jgi:two-component system OmpR family response regulator
MQASAQLLVVSPDDAVLRIAERCASALGHIVFSACDLVEARRALARVLVDLVCLDAVLPEDELERFWAWVSADAQRAETPVVLLAPRSAAIAPAALPSFFRPERHALVAKPLRRDDLARAVARLLAAMPRSQAAVELYRAGEVTLDVASHRLLFAGGGSLALTPTEARLLRCLLAEPGRFVPPEELLERVWGYPPGTGGREVVRAHVSNVRRKLRSIGADAGLLRNVPHQGYGFMAGTEAPPALAPATAE